MKLVLLTLSILSLNTFAAGGLESLRLENADQKLFPRAEKYSYQCVQSSTLKESGSNDWKTKEEKYSGSGEDFILDAQNQISTEVDDYGRTVTKIKKEQIDAEMTKKTIETEFISADGQYNHKTVAVQLIQKINGVDTVIATEVDGKPSVVRWTKYHVELDAKTSIFTTVYHQPSLLNRDGAEYSRVFQSCIYTNQ